MLRPATPLTITLFISFVLLLLSVLSTPIVSSIPLGAFEGVNFGVFGYCTPDKCSGVRVGYTTDGLFANDEGNWNLPANTRNSLSSLLIVHPVAAFMNLIALALAAAGHLHSPSHSARYLLGLLILLLPTLLVTLLAFLVDILLFVPHLQWGGWIVLGSTILITISGVITCAMRRTLVSRKARKKRIAENAEMSGENFYNRQAQEAKLPTAPTFSTVESKAPLINGTPGANTLPSFATYDSSQRNEGDRLPLTSAAVNDGSQSAINTASSPSIRYDNPPSRSNSRPPPRDQFGNLVPLGEGPGSFATIPGRSPSSDRGPPGPFRDNGMPPPRGGYGPRGRGGYPPRGGHPPRGGYGPRGPPPQGYGRGGYPIRGRGGYPQPGGMMAAEGMGRGPRQPPPGYGPSPDAAPERYGPPNEADVVSPSIYSAHPSEYEAYGARAQSPGRGASPYGSRAQSPGGRMRQSSPPPAMPPLPSGPVAEMDGRNPVVSPVPEEYVPPRSNWDGGRGRPPPQGYRPPPAELSSSNSQLRGYGGPQRPRVNSGGSDVYYEDVDPRFQSDPEPMPQGPLPGGQPVPQLLTPGGGAYHDESPDSYTNRPPPLPMQSSYEDLPGARSPAESEDTNFTSVSQRGVNPNWKPGHGGEFNNLAPMRRPPGGQVQAKRDVLLAGNPDFEIPGMTPPGRRGGRGGYRGGMGGGPPRMGPPPASAMGGMAGDGPYPRGPPPMGDVREI